MRGQRGVRGAPPTPTTSFVGRRGEVAEVRRLLGLSHVVTLVGPPGVGKTRLALRTAEDVARSFSDGVWFVDLAGLRDSALLVQEVAGALDLHDASTRWAVDGLARHLHTRDLLLLLDNCEHMIDACAVLIDSLSRMCPALRVLATSRQSIGISGEATLRIRPLAFPDEGSVDGEAVDLLLERAAATLPDFAPQESDLRAAAVLCRRLDGIPLAIELAAVRLKTLTIGQMVQRLDDRFAVLGRREATGPEHHRTLQAALDWSRDLVSAEEWLLWRRLSTFPTSFDLAAVEAICAGDALPTDRVLDALDGLVDKSVVTATRIGSSMRYRLLDSIREYGLRVLEGDEWAAVAARHGDYYAALCRQAWGHWTDAEQPIWFDRLDVEHDNLRAALDGLLERDPEAGAEMAANMWLYWEARGHITEGRRRLSQLLEAIPQHSIVRAKATWVAGYLAAAQSDIEAAIPLLSEALDVAAAAHETETVAYATQYLGMCHLFAGDLAVAERDLERAFVMHRDGGDRVASFALADLALCVMLAGDAGRAITLFEQALERTASGGDPWTRSHAFWGLGVATLVEGDLERADRAQKEALQLIGDLDERSGIALCLDALAWVAAAGGDLERAATLQGAGASVWESIPGHLPPPFAGHALDCEQRAVDGLGSSRREELFRQGRRLDRAEAVALGLDVQPAVPDERPARRGPSGLSKRESEVAELVAQGLTDRQISTRLVISQRTAESHVQHILTKLGFRSRTQIAAWVAGAKPPESRARLGGA